MLPSSRRQTIRDILEAFEFRSTFAGTRFLADCGTVVLLLSDFLSFLLLLFIFKMCLSVSSGSLWFQSLQ